MTTRQRSLAAPVLALVILFITFGSAASATDLELAVRDDAANAISGADVTIESNIHEATKETDFEGMVLFENLNQSTFDVTVEKDGYKQRELRIDVRETDERTIVLDEETVGDLTLQVTGENDRALDDVDVELSQIDGAVTESGTTDSYGELSFEELPAGSYEAELTEDTYADKTITVDVTAGEDTVWSTSMTQDGTEEPSDLIIEEYRVPSPLRRGGTATITLTARNQDTRDIDDLNASIFIFDTNQTITNISIDEDSTQTEQFDIDVPQDAAGEYDLRLTVSNDLYNATQTGTVTVSNYEGFIELGSDDVTLGDTVFINGQITNTETGDPARTMGASLYLDRTLITGVTTDQTGRISTYVRPSSVGTKTIRLQNQYVDIEERLYVKPALSLTRLQATPNTIQRGQTSEICATISTERSRDITLTVNRGEETVYDRTRTIDTEKRPCVTVQYNETGTITTEVIASWRGISETLETTVTVTEEPDFPFTVATTGQLDVEPDGNTTAWINITNPTETNKTGTITLDTINNSWLAWTNTSFKIGPNQTEQHDLTVTPTREGEYVIETTVTAGGENRTTLIDLKVQEPIQSVARRYYRGAQERAEAAWQTVSTGNRPMYIGIATGLLIIIVFIIYYRRYQTPAPLEPQNR